MKVNFKQLSSSLVSNVGPLAPILIAAAFASVWFASSSIKSAATSIKTANESTTQAVKLERTPITDATALSAAQRLTKLSPATTIAVSGKFVVVSIPKPELFAEWVHALTEVQSIGKDVQWEVDDMCIASCEGGESAKAYLTAYKQQIKVH
jgi:hypothetical protein